MLRILPPYGPVWCHGAAVLLCPESKYSVVKGTSDNLVLGWPRTHLI